MSNIIWSCENLSKDYFGPLGNIIHLLEDVSFQIELNKTTCIIAPKGAGKSTLLKIIAGILNYSSGKIINSGGGRTTFIPSKPSSFPWLNVADNIRFANSNISDSELLKLVSLVGLEGYEDHFPNNRSIGFRFRISLARALAVNPELIVIDEPFNEIDPLTKSEMYKLIRDVNNAVDVTFVIGTTNISEALLLAEQIILMKKNPGKIIRKMDIEFPGNRDESIITSIEFRNYREEIEKIFRENHTMQLFSISV